MNLKVIWLDQILGNLSARTDIIIVFILIIISFHLIIHIRWFCGSGGIVLLYLISLYNHINPHSNRCYLCVYLLWCAQRWPLLILTKLVKIDLSLIPQNPSYLFKSALSIIAIWCWIIIPFYFLIHENTYGHTF